MRGHEFRQTQTALSAYVMQQDGFKLAYETPVLGKPWSIPMEFPLYQAMVAGLARLTGWDLVVSGRLVAWGAFLLGLPAWWGLARLAGYSRGGACLVLIPILLAPVQVFYSRTFMIESTAWCLSAWFLWAVLSYRRDGRPEQVVGALLFGGLAVLVKATTWAVFCLPWAMLYLRDGMVWWSQRDREMCRRLLVQALIIGVPLLLLGRAWVGYADMLKAQNPMASFLLSDALVDFNFGTWADRGDGAIWQRLIGHIAPSIWPLWLGGMVGLLALGTRRTRMLLGLSLVAFAGGPLIFFNLYAIHDYYFYANASFAVVTAGWVAAECWDRSRWAWRGPVAAVLLLVLVGWGQVQSYWSGLGRVQTTEAFGDHGFTRTLRELTAPDDVIVVHTWDWSSLLPFYTQRRMLVIPDFHMQLEPERVRAGIALLHDEHVPLLVLQGQARKRTDWIIARIEQLGLWPEPLFRWHDEIDVYTTPALYDAMWRELDARQQEGVVLNSNLWHTQPVTARRQVTGTPAGTQVEQQLGIHVREAVMPYGYDIVDDAGRDMLLVHAVSELVFEVPPGARFVSLSYRVNPASCAQPDFDGMSLVLDVVAGTRIVQTLHREWLSPHDGMKLREMRLELPSTQPETLVLRVLPGINQGLAYDQLWLGEFRFE